MDRLEDCNGLGEGHPKSFMVRSTTDIKLSRQPMEIVNR